MVAEDKIIWHVMWHEAMQQHTCHAYILDLKKNWWWTKKWSQISIAESKRQLLFEKK